VVTSTTNFRGGLTPSFTRRAPERFERASERLAVEKKKVEARRRGQMRALTRF